MKLPAIQFYPGDWRKDPGVQSLNYHDRGIWFEILCLMSESKKRGKLMLNNGPMSDEVLAKLLGVEISILQASLTTLLERGVASRDKETGVLINRRMVRDECLRAKRKRCGKLGGNPNLVNHVVNPLVQTVRNQKTTPSSSSSSSSSDVYRGFKKPSLEEVKLAAAKTGLVESEAEKFFHFYESKGWHVGKQVMKSWPSALAGWKIRNQSTIVATQPSKQESAQW